MKYSFVLLAAAAAVEAVPFPQGVTQSIAPSATAPAGCAPTYSGTFGIAVMNITAASAPPAPTGAGVAGAVSQIPDGQVQQAPTTAAPVNQIPDGQVQQGPSTMAPINQIGDGQIQQQRPTATPVKQIPDGQIQQPSVTPVNQIPDGQIQQPSVTPVNQIPDGQVQQPSVTPVNQIPDGQVQQPSVTPVNQIPDGQVQQPSGTPVNQIPDGQVQQPSGTPVNQIPDGQIQQPSGTPINQIPDGQPQATAPAAPGGTSGGAGYVSCQADDTLQITLANGVLTDSQGRIGYIASNYQFQFDGPPQAGAIYTAGFSVCGNGTLALGGSTTFYQCLSGDFYNLYDRSWAPQCEPINIQVVQLVSC